MKGDINRMKFEFRHVEVEKSVQTAGCPVGRQEVRVKEIWSRKTCREPIGGGG